MSLVTRAKKKGFRQRKGMWGARWSLERHPNSLHSGASCFVDVYVRLPTLCCLFDCIQNSKFSGGNAVYVQHPCFIRHTRYIIAMLCFSSPHPQTSCLSYPHPRVSTALRVGQVHLCYCYSLPPTCRFLSFHWSSGSVLDKSAHTHDPPMPATSTWHAPPSLERNRARSAIPVRSPVPLRRKDT